jgi:fatty acid desaturase
MTCNLGLHTAHHKRPGVHWSLLPQIHEEIKDQIPQEMILTTFW